MVMQSVWANYLSFDIYAEEGLDAISDYTRASDLMQRKMLWPENLIMDLLYVLAKHCTT